MSTSRRVIVVHEGYGCDTGCCGHVIRIDDTQSGRFHFGHPEENEDWKEWAKNLVAEELGAEHAADLDWDNCIISDD